MATGDGGQLLPAAAAVAVAGSRSMPPYLWKQAVGAAAHFTNNIIELSSDKFSGKIGNNL